MTLLQVVRKPAAKTEREHGTGPGTVVQDGNVLRVLRDTRADMMDEMNNAHRLRVVQKTSTPPETVNRRTGRRTRHNLIQFELQVPIVIEGREYTRSEIARAAGIGITYVSKIFRGERTPSIYRARLIAAAIGLSLDAFYDILTKIDVGQHIEPEDRLKSDVQHAP